MIWFHTGTADLKGPAAHFGGQGVALFFAISGFLITTLLLRERDRRSVIDLRAFYVRRILRIFPLYYATLFVYVLAVLLVERDSAVGHAFFGNLIYYATYTSNWFIVGDGRVIFLFAWSLAAEEQFYLVWPPLLKRLGSVKAALWFVVLLLVVLSILQNTAVAGMLPNSLAMIGKVANFIPLAILGGVALALGLHLPSGFKWLRPWIAGGQWNSLGWCLVAGLLTALPDVPLPIMPFVLVLFVGSCVVREDHVLSSLLSWRPIAYVGSISYGMYLLHMLSKNFVLKVLPISLGESRVIVFALTLGLVVVLAGLSFKHFESHFLALKARYSK